MIEEVVEVVEVVEVEDIDEKRFSDIEEDLDDTEESVGLVLVLVLVLVLEVAAESLPSLSFGNLNSAAYILFWLSSTINKVSDGVESHRLRFVIETLPLDNVVCGSCCCGRCCDLATLSLVQFMGV